MELLWRAPTYMHQCYIGDRKPHMFILFNPAQQINKIDQSESSCPPIGQGAMHEMNTPAEKRG